MRFRTDHHVPHRKGEGHIVFGVDPVGVGVSVRVGDGVTLFFVCDISCQLVVEILPHLHRFIIGQGIELIKF